MPARRRPGKRVPRRARKMRKVRSKRKSLNPQKQYATSLETVSFKTLTDNSLYQSSFHLGQFPRSSAIAACYKWCRPVEVVYEYMPLYNMFQESSTGAPGVTVPQFFSYMNRTGDIQAPTGSAAQLAWILSTGTKARAFNKKIVIKYKPNWLSSGLLVYGNTTGTENVNRLISMGAKPEFGWVPCPTNIPQGVTQIGGAADPENQSYLPDSVPSGTSGLVDINSVSVNCHLNYQGHMTYIRQAVEGDTLGVAELKVTVKWQFKNPNPQYYKIAALEDTFAKLIN